MLRAQDAFSTIISAASLNPRSQSRSAEPESLNVALIGTFAPRKCGIATFTEDLKTQVEAHHRHISFDVYALDRKPAAADYADPIAVIDVDCPEAYRAAARRINASGADAVWLQHEYGIFGGRDGAHVLELAAHLAVPLVVTFHTILSDPSDSQRAVLDALLACTDRAMVMSQHGCDLLVANHGVAPERITIIAHGAPDRPFGREERFKAALGCAGRPVLMTFGLLGPGKGLEHAIEAMPAIASRHPGVLYRIVGATHPNLVREQGEAYRDGLKARAAELGVADNIAWDDRFLETAELLDQLEACDVYLTPYPNLQQSTSGTLSYAVALGKAVVSTPYIHARELLAGGAGLIVPVGQPDAIAEAVGALLADPKMLESLKESAYAKGRSTVWPRFAQAAANLIAGAVDPGRIVAGECPQPDQTSAFSFGRGLRQNLRHEHLAVHSRPADHRASAA